MSRWKKEDATPHAVYMRTWMETEEGKAYRERRNEYAREWRKKNKDKFKTTQKAAYHRARLEALQHYSGLQKPECKCCGEDMFDFLTFDHINGDGAAHRREIGMAQGNAAQVHNQGQKVNIGGNGFVYWLKKNDWPEGFQVLCWNCNGAKREGRECPHIIARRVHPDQLNLF